MFHRDPNTFMVYYNTMCTLEVQRPKKRIGFHQRLQGILIIPNWGLLKKIVLDFQGVVVQSLYTPRTTREPLFFHCSPGFTPYPISSLRCEVKDTVQQAMDDQMAQVGAPGKVLPCFFFLVFPGVFRVFFSWWSY